MTLCSSSNRLTIHLRGSEPSLAFRGDGSTFLGMSKFVFFVAVLVVVLVLSTCTASATMAPLLPINGDGDPIPYGPSSALWPETSRASFSVPLPSDLAGWLQLIFLGGIGYFLRRQTLLMEPKRK